MSEQPRWTFLSNHAYVLVCLARQPDIRLRDVADLVGITERAVQKIVSDLDADGIVTRTRFGRRNKYSLDLERPLRHDLTEPTSVGELLAALLDKDTFGAIPTSRKGPKRGRIAKKASPRR